jgi:hypothetical protein
MSRERFIINSKLNINVDQDIFAYLNNESNLSKNEFLIAIVHHAHNLRLMNDPINRIDVYLDPTGHTRRMYIALYTKYVSRSKIQFDFDDLA